MAVYRDKYLLGIANEEMFLYNDPVGATHLPSALHLEIESIL